MIVPAMLACALAATVRVSVFGLFHPVEIEVRPAHGAALVVESDGRSEVLEGAHSKALRGAARVSGRDGAPASFVLMVPRKIQREYFGRLEVRPSGHGDLLAIVEMDREIAVASVVAAELPEAEPEDAMKAMAVIARSFLAGARGRHDGFDFCDTTHCQFLRAPPAESSLAARATRETRDLVVVYQDRVVPALYSANCGGHTRSLAEAGWAVGDYPYFPVECLVHGAPSGHRIGLCQQGAAEMARRGASFRQIIASYFPGTAVEPIPP